MNYIVLDLEWNQSGEVAKEGKQPLTFEIIEIGAIKLNSDKRMVGEFSQLIRPQVFHQMHYMTRKLIHLQMEELEQGKPFTEVMEAFQTWCGEDYVFCTWGPMDLMELQKNMQFYGMPSLSEGPIIYYDVQKIFSLCCEEDVKVRRNLEYAVDFLKIEKDIPFHRAFSDAYYTAKVFGELADILQRQGEKADVMEKMVSFDTVHAPRTKKDEIFVIFETYAKYISKGYDNKTQLMSDRDVISTRCYLCNKNLRRKIRWYSYNSKNYYSVSYCDKHGYMKGKIRTRKDCNDRTYAIKTQKFISQDTFEEMQAKYQKVKEARRRL